MKIRCIYKKHLVICLISIFAIFTAIGIIYFSKATKANNMFSDFTINKIKRLKQEDKKAAERAKQGSTDKTDTQFQVPQQMPLDPKQKVERIPPDEGWSIGWLYNGAYNVSELWIVGDKPNYEQKSWNPSYAYSGCLKDDPQQGFIGTFVMDGASDDTWTGNWKIPDLWGSVKIIDVTGNIISFTTECGAKGTFNMDTHEWKTN